MQRREAVYGENGRITITRRDGLPMADHRSGPSTANDTEVKSTTISGSKMLISRLKIMNHRTIYSESLDRVDPVSYMSFKS